MCHFRSDRGSAGVDGEEFPLTLNSSDSIFGDSASSSISALTGPASNRAPSRLTSDVSCLVCVSWWLESLPELSNGAGIIQKLQWQHESHTVDQHFKMESITATRFFSFSRQMHRPLRTAFDEAADVRIGSCGWDYDCLSLLILQRHELHDGLGLSKAQELLQRNDLLFKGHYGPAVQYLTGHILDIHTRNIICIKNSKLTNALHLGPKILHNL